MGLLKILSRRSGKGRSSDGVLQSKQDTPLQTTRSACVSISEAPTSSLHCEARLSEVSLVRPNAATMKSPPLKPAFRGVLDNDRPGSAESSRSGIGDQSRPLQRPKREARRPPVSFRKPSSLSLTQMSLATQQDPPQLGENGSVAASPMEGHLRAGSMTSLARRQSRDLLDAVEEFRPLDFRSRVQAAGARDYGEDVADRNMCLLTTVSSPDLFSQFSSARSLSAQSARAYSRTKSIDSIREHYDSTIREMSSLADGSHPGSSLNRNKSRLSINTCKASGIVSPTIKTPRSTVTLPGHRRVITSRDLNPPGAGPDPFSRPNSMSPPGTHFSIPISSVAILHPIEACDPQTERVDENSFAEEQEIDDIAPTNRSSQRRSAASGGQVFIKGGARSSHGTFRSSLASSVTSRDPSMDFMPLGYPRLQGNPKMDFNSDSDDISIERSQSLRSHRHSKSDSSGNAYSQQRTRSLLTTPSGLKHSVEVDGQTLHPGSSSSIRDWALVTPSNGSTSSFSNGLYSGASGSIRPVSRHTKATSIDSMPRPSSSHSCMSASVGQSASGWSPSTTRSTTRSTGFNIDDYVSSDDDSFTTEKHPSGEGEEELLFKDGYGATGAALPGLLESIMDACPPPAVGARASRLMSLSKTTEEESEVGDDYDAAEVPDIEDDRLSENRDLPCTLLWHAQGNSEHHEHSRTFGKQLGMTRAHIKHTPIPSLLPGDDLVETKTPALSTSSSNTSIYEEMRPPCRGQKRLSALGTVHGRTLDSAGGEDVNRSNSKQEPMTSLSKEEVNPVAAARLRKEAKARKREAEAKIIWEKRRTRAFGALDENVLCMLRAQDKGDIEERGRTRVRGAKGKSVILG